MIVTLLEIIIVILVLILSWNVVGIFIDARDRRDSEKWIDQIANRVDGGDDKSKNDPPPMDHTRRH